MPDEKLNMLRQMNPQQKEELISKIEQTACELEKTVCGCSRCVLGALQQHLNIGNSETLKASTPFAAGFARSTDVCGALSGAAMAVGIAYSTDKMVYIFADHSDARLYLDAMQHVIKIRDRFRETFGSIRCFDIQKMLHGRTWDLNNPKELSEFMNPEIHDKCGDVGKVAARLAAEEILGLGKT